MLIETVIVIVIATATKIQIKDIERPKDIFLFKGYHPFIYTNGFGIYNSGF